MSNTSRTVLTPEEQTLVRSDKVAVKSEEYNQTKSFSLDELCIGKQLVNIPVVAMGTDNNASDDVARFCVPPALDGYRVSEIGACVGTLGVGTGDTEVSVRKLSLVGDIGDETTQFDITDETGDVAKYLYDGTGTDPEIDDDPASNIQVGDYISIRAENFNANNVGEYYVTGVGANYFTVTNAATITGENNKTIGTGYIRVWRANDLLAHAGTHDGGDGEDTLTDSDANWKEDSLVGLTLTNSTDGSSGTITANTATTVTAELSGGTGDEWDDDDAYTIDATLSLMAYDMSKTTEAIDGTVDDVEEGDILAIDIDGVHGTTDSTGLSVTVGFEKFEEALS